MNLRSVLTVGIAVAFAIVETIAVSAGEVTPEQAQAAARNWLKRNPWPMTAKMKSSNVQRLHTSRNSFNKALYHAVDVEGGGLVILSGDTRLPPVIAFSDDGNASLLEKGHPLFDLLESDMAQRIEAVNAKQTAIPNSTKSTAMAATNSIKANVSYNNVATPFEIEWKGLLEEKSSVKPLISANVSGGDALAISDLDVRVYPRKTMGIRTQWDQGLWNGEPTFNYYTPKLGVGLDRNGNPCGAACGCVATAFAQVMKKFEYPKSAQVSKHLCWVNGVVTNMSMIGGEYIWNNMPDVEEDCKTDMQRRALGKLVFDVGVASQMAWDTEIDSKGREYSVGGTPATLGAKALRETFGYKSACAYEGDLSRNIKEVADFGNAILGSLDAEMPVVIGLNGDGGGHAILMDGYGLNKDKTLVYCHLNFGWSGLGNGYWYNVMGRPLSPMDNGKVYTNMCFVSLRRIVYNIHPQEEGDVISGRVLNEYGRPVAKATVTLKGGGSGKISPTTTNDKGIWFFRITSPGQYTATAKKNGREAQPQDVIIAEKSRNTSYALDANRHPMNKADGCLGNKWGVELRLPGEEKDDTPVDLGEEDPGSETGSGSITSEDDWIKIATGPNAKTATFSIGANLTLSSISCCVGSFSGVVKGNGYTITITEPLKSWGLFSPSGATFERVTFDGFSFGRAESCKFIKCRPQYVPLVDEATRCTFIDCMGTVSIATSTFRMGALSCIAKNCTFKNCKVWGSISGGDNTGGLVGNAEGCSFTDCISLAKVSGDSEVGGLVGWAEANCKFSSCAARGEVSGRAFVGGLVGYCEGSTLDGCQAIGNVTGGNTAGGFAGQLRNCEVQKCSAKGKVTLDSSFDITKSGIGGFAGEIVGIDNGTVSLMYCVATGAVSAEGGSNVGGFVGDCHGETATTKIQCSYASGLVVGGTVVGGFAGSLSSCSVFNCYSIGSATAKGTLTLSGSSMGIDTGSSAYAGGFAGSATYEGGVDCRFCYASGYVKASTSESSVLNLVYTGGFTPLAMPAAQAEMLSEDMMRTLGLISRSVACYWNTDSTGQKYSGMGEGRKAAVFTKKATFSGWNFEDIWAINEGSSFPYLRELGGTGNVDIIGDDGGDEDEPEPTPTPSYVVKVVFDANGGLVSPSSKDVIRNWAIGAMPTPSKSGYNFNGWWTDRSGGIEVTANTIIMASMTLYAHWIDKDQAQTYTVRRADVHGGHRQGASEGGGAEVGAADGLFVPRLGDVGERDGGEVRGRGDGEPLVYGRGGGSPVRGVGGADVRGEAPPEQLSEGHGNGRQNLHCWGVASSAKGVCAKMVA